MILIRMGKIRQQVQTFPVLLFAKHISEPRQSRPLGGVQEYTLQARDPVRVLWVVRAINEELFRPAHRGGAAPTMGRPRLRLRQGEPRQRRRALNSVLGLGRSLWWHRRRIMLAMAGRVGPDAPAAPADPEVAPPS